MTDLEARLGRALADRYVIERELGRGGMAVVYLVHDLRHGRRLALKVLAPEVAQVVGTDRFLREIQIAARLSHPRILPLLDSGSVDGLLFFAMPFVEGESLRERLDREKQLQVDDAVEIARQVASALAYAHAQGVVHRDIKPENILLSAGEARVADFGVARAVTSVRGAGLTSAGLAVGTPAYMSPEQASGVTDVDGRSDVYALACVLYEMLAGEPPFAGRTAQAVTARKLSQPAPNVLEVRDSVPASIGDALRRALARLPADRYATAAQFAEALRSEPQPRPTQTLDPVGMRTRSKERVVMLALGAIVALATAFSALQWLEDSVLPVPVRMTVTLPAGVKVTHGPGYASSVALSPDGRALVVAGTSVEGQRLYQRSLDRLEAAPLAGTEGGSSPFYSPDGAWLGFFAEGRLRIIPAAGGAAVDVTAVPGYAGGAHWGPDDRIVFASGARAPIFAVDAGGGAAERLTTLEAGEVSHNDPELLPDGRTLLFESRGSVHALDLASGRRVELAAGASPRYAASGHVILSRGTTLLAAPFDARRLELRGPLVPLVEGVAREGSGQLRHGRLHYALSRSGALAYVPGPSSHALVLVEPDGTERFVTAESLAFENPQFSPDGRRLAVAASRRLGEPADIWIHDLEAGTAKRLTFDGGRAPVWLPDGTAVSYSRLGDQQGIYTKPADGPGEAERVLPLDEFHWLIGWSPDGGRLAFGMMEGATEAGVSRSSILTFDAGAPAARRLIGPGSVWGGRLSPDGRWLAYYVLEAGRFEVYVTRFPEGRLRWQISDEGGRDPTWGSDAEVYYRSGDRLMAARIDTTTGVTVGRRLVLEPFSPPLYDDYDVHPVHGRTLAIVRPPDEYGRDVVVVLDWFADIRRATTR